MNFEKQLRNALNFYISFYFKIDMVKADSVNDREAFWHGRALEYLDGVDSASQSDICRKIGLKYHLTKLLVHYLLENSLIQSYFRKYSCILVCV